MKYLAAEYYRGSMGVNSLRLFSSKAEAHEYVKGFTINGKVDHFTRVYRLFKDKPPELIRFDK